MTSRTSGTGHDDVSGDPRSILTRAARAPDAVVVYGPDPNQICEVWWPRRSLTVLDQPVAALVLLIHGGFWQAEYDCAHARPMAVALADAGHVVGSVEYRRLGSPGGGWPGTFDDVSAAVDQLPDLIGASAPGHVEIDGVVLVGHSAGGQLVLWAAARHRLPKDSGWHRTPARDLRGVVALAPVAELGRADREDVGEGAVAELLGGHLAERPDQYAAADPAVLGPVGVRTVVIHGDADAQVPIEHSRSYVQRARTGGDDATLVELPGKEHFGLIDPLSAAWPIVLETVQMLAGPAGLRPDVKSSRSARADETARLNVELPGQRARGRGGDPPV